MTRLEHMIYDFFGNFYFVRNPNSEAHTELNDACMLMKCRKCDQLVFLTESQDTLSTYMLGAQEHSRACDVS